MTGQSFPNGRNDTEIVGIKLDTTPGGGSMPRQFLFFILILLALAKARAQTGVISTSAQNTTQAPISSEFKGSFDISTTGNLSDAETSDGERSSSIEMTVSHKRLSVSFGGTAEHSGAKNSDLNNTVLTYSAEPIVLDSLDTVQLSARGLFATNESDREEASLRGGVSGRVAYNYKSNYSFHLDVLKSLHKFDRSNLGSANTSYRGRVVATALFPLARSIELSLYAHYQAGRTYTDALRTSFRLDQEISFSLNDKRGSIYVAHSNSGNALGADGEDSAVEVFDQNTSVLSAGYRNLF